VARDVKYGDLRNDTGPMFYRPVLQTRSSDALTLHVRLAADPDAVIGAIRAEMQRFDPAVPLFRMTTLEEQLDTSFAHTRQAAALTGVFGLLALVLSAVGVYGVAALALTRRTRDIGIRMALGAAPRHIARAFGRRGVAIVGAGVALGLAGALAVTRAAGTLLYGIAAADAATFAGMAVLLGLVSSLAFSIPTRRAMCLDAVSAIRTE
jgi:putative ABC transport system permease protein